MSEYPPDSIATDKASEGEPTRYGRNVRVRNHWIRHAQKQSGEVFSTDKDGISKSSISEKGVESSQDHGRSYTAAIHGAKGYASTSPRTKETLEHVFAGYQEANPAAEVRDVIRLRDALNPIASKEFMKLYDEKWNENKRTLLEARGLTLEDFPTLTPDEQQEIAEEAEEPVVREWLDNPESELAMLQDKSIAASVFARYFANKHGITKWLPEGSDVDLFNGTHKTVAEPFLISGVLVDPQTGNHITSLADLGGSIGILESWDSEVSIDSDGNRTFNVFIRGKEYTIDQARLEELLIRT